MASAPSEWADLGCVSVFACLCRLWTVSLPCNLSLMDLRKYSVLSALYYCQDRSDDFQVLSMSELTHIRTAYPGGNFWAASWRISLIFHLEKVILPTPNCLPSLLRLLNMVGLRTLLVPFRSPVPRTTCLPCQWHILGKWSRAPIQISLLWSMTIFPFLDHGEYHSDIYL